MIKKRFVLRFLMAACHSAFRLERSRVINAWTLTLIQGEFWIKSPAIRTSAQNVPFLDSVNA